MTKPQSNSSLSLISLALGLWTGLLVIYLIELFFIATPGHDQAWLLCAAQRMVAGAKLYDPQIVETNPPLILWFSAIPILLGHILHIDPLPALKLTIAVLVILSTVWCARILRVAEVLTSRLLVCVAIGSILGAEVFLHAYDLGQREHLLVLFLLPYILAAIFVRRLHLSIAEQCALGVVAGIAVCFKPQQVILLIAFELFLAAWTRSLRRLLQPALLSAIGTILAYIALVHMLTPQYFTTIVPLLRETYWPYQSFSAWQLIKTEPLFDAVFLFLLLLFFTQRRRLRFPLAVGAFLASSFAGAIVYCLQHANAPYQAYPQNAFLLLAVFWLILSLLPSALASVWRPNLTFAVSAAIIALMFSPLLIIAARNPAGSSSYPAQVLAQYPPQTPVYVFSDDVWDAFPAVMQDHLVWASRFAHLWMLPAIVKNEIAESGGPAPVKTLSPATVQQLAVLQRTETTEDFQRWQPSVVIVRRCSPSNPCAFLGPIDFNPIPWFLKSPAFAAEWSHYRFQSTHGPFDVYIRIP